MRYSSCVVLGLLLALAAVGCDACLIEVGGKYQPCSASGSCQAGLFCNDDNVCVPAPTDDAGTASDARSDATTDLASGDRTGEDTVGEDTGGEDSGPAVDCREEGCSGFTYCDETSGDCLPGCTDSLQCVTNAECNSISHQCQCLTGHHTCVGACVSNIDPGSCGISCSSCPTDSNGSATCDGTDCGIQCDTGFHLCPGLGCFTDTDLCPIDCPVNYHQCPGGCAANNAVASCGDRCEPCASDANGVATCDGVNCGIICNDGHHWCEGLGCASSTSTASCGTSCTLCPTDPHGSATCNGTSCGLSCDPGYHDCNGSCASNSDTGTCGLSCSPCPDSDPHGLATCNGTSCGIACDPDYHMCGSTCAFNQAVATCGLSCAPCPGDPHGQTTCNGIDCGIDCNPGYHLCPGEGCIPVGTDCSLDCNPGYHQCPGFGYCLNDTSTQSCGDRCEPCPDDPHGTPTCVSGVCDISCAGGYHWCQGQGCVYSSDPLTCGASCAPCPDPSHGEPTCNGTSCGLSCDSGYHECSGQCEDSNDPATCGERCTPCPGDANGTASCDGDFCGLSCNGGFHECPGHGCVSNSDPDTCGVLCSPCPTDPNGSVTCNGIDCGLSCFGGYTNCSAQGCVDATSVDHCGGRCTPCPTDPHGQAQCVAYACEIECNSGYLMCSGACAACPTSPGILNYGCDSAGRCIATRCDETLGFHPCGNGCCTWQVDMLDDQFLYSFLYPAIAVDSTGQPHIGYRSSGLTYSTGTPESTQVIRSAAVKYIDIAVDDADHPHLVWREDPDEVAREIWHARHNGSIWETDLVYTDPEVNGYPALAIDSLGNPHVAFLAMDTGLTYARFQTTWTTEEIALDVTPADIGSYAIAVDNDNVPRIAFVYTYNGGASSSIQVRTRTDNWAPSEVEHADDEYLTVSLAIDSGDRSHLAYALSTADIFRYAVSSGSSWSYQDVHSSPNYAGIKIALHHQLEPRVALLSGDVHLAVPFQGGWDLYPVGTSSGTKILPDFALDPDGDPHIIFQTFPAAELLYAH